MKRVGILSVAFLGLSLLATGAQAQGYQRSLSVRGGYDLASESSDFASSSAYSLVGTSKLGRRAGLMASVGYQPSARTSISKGDACFLDGGCPHAHQEFGLASVGFGIKYELGNLSINQYLPSIEILPTLYYAEWGEQRDWFSGEITAAGMRKVFPGVQTNIVFPIKLGSSVNLDLGVGYAYSSAVQRDDGARRSGLRHLHTFGGITYGM